MNELRIAIVEDNATSAKMLSYHLEHWREPVVIEQFSSAEDFFDKFWAYKYGLIFMDIYMDGMNGVEAVECIRKNDKITPIAFTTTSPDFTMDGYKLGVMRYIEKPVEKEAVFGMLEVAQVFRSNPTGPSLSFQKGMINLLIAGMIFLEQIGNEMLVHMTDGREVNVRGKLDEYEEILSGHGFFRSHKGFLVNMHYVTGIDRELLVYNMVDGSMAGIRRESLKAAREAWEEKGKWD